MTKAVPKPRPHRRVGRIAAMAATVLALSMVAAPVALAAPPEHFPTDAPPIEFAEGEVCDDPVRFENLVLHMRDTAFGPGPRDDGRYLSRGSAVSLVTNLRTLETYRFQGGVRITLTFAMDGSVRARASGTALLAWYYEGDDSELAPGLYHISGAASEWYAPDGSLIRATHRGVADDLCARVGA